MAVTNQLVTLLIGPSTRTLLGRPDLNSTKPNPPLQSVVEFDATINESHSLEAVITDHPIEYGAVISDHYRLQPEKLTIEGVITNVPLPSLANPAASLQNVKDSLKSGIYQDESTSRTAKAYDQLHAYMRSATMLTVLTSLREYENMMITSVAIERNSKTGAVLHATLGLRELRRARVVRGHVAAVKANTEAGQVAPVEAKPAQDEKTTTNFLFGDKVDEIRSLGKKLFLAP